MVMTCGSYTLLYIFIVIIIIVYNRSFFHIPVKETSFITYDDDADGDDEDK